MMDFGEGQPVELPKDLKKSLAINLIVKDYFNSPATIKHQREFRKQLYWTEKVSKNIVQLLNLRMSEVLRQKGEIVLFDRTTPIDEPGYTIYVIEQKRVYKGIRSLNGDGKVDLNSVKEYRGNVSINLQRLSAGDPETRLMLSIACGKKDFYFYSDKPDAGRNSRFEIAIIPKGREQTKLLGYDVKDSLQWGLAKDLVNDAVRTHYK